MHRGRHPVLMWVKTGFRRGRRPSPVCTSAPGSTAAPTARTAWPPPSTRARSRPSPTRFPPTSSRARASSPTSRPAVPSAGTARPSRASPRVPDRQGGRAAGPRSGGHAAAQPRRALHQDRQPPDRHDHRIGRVHRSSRRGVRLEAEVEGAPARQGHRHRLLVLSHRGGHRHLLERHAPLGRGGARRPQRRRVRPLRRHRHRAGLGLGAGLSGGRGARHRAQGHPRARGGHRPHPGGPGLLLLARHPHGGQRRHPGRRAAARQIFDAVARKLEVDAGAPGRAGPPRLRGRRRGAAA